MIAYPQFNGFDGDSANRDKNKNKHQVEWWECEEAFFNQPLYVQSDAAHSHQEPRYYALGKTGQGRLLFIIFTNRRSKIRIISARDMHKKERRIYHEKAQKDSGI
ncbi:BrnT family toxin [candidate division TA06 bacterium]|uniref:BrnT family toxin n=1 Tax=candidate division TA06 bacterium TaxID=2250710 RepID=A0A933MKD1_UNCT6|nr:BrnT family toxin [candidate division TA06 bacterium]